MNWSGGSRRWLARLAAIGVGVGLLAGSEIALRLLWEPPRGEQIVWAAIDPYRVVDGIAQTREEFQGVMRLERFPAEKPADTYRVFAIGGSTAFGYPFEAEVAWPQRLQERMGKLYPGRSVEIINAGGTSYGSSRALGVLRALEAYAPNLVVFCGGDAEFVEDSFRVSVESRGVGRRALRSLYLSRLLLQWLPSPARTLTVNTSDAGAAGFLFSPTVQGTVYRPSPERREQVLRRFRENLRRMAEVAARGGFDLALCTLPSNTATWAPDPDAGEPPDPAMRARWRALWERGRDLGAAGDLRGAAGAYREAAALWSDNAELRFALGQALLAAETMDESVGHLAAARDLDPTPVRASSAVNDALRDLARRRGLLLVDAEAAFVGASGSGPVGEDLILDYAHPTPLGHALLSRVVWAALAGVPGPWGTYGADAERELWEEEVARAKAAEPALDPNLQFVWGQIHLRKGRPQRAAELLREAIRGGYDLPYAPLYLGAALVEMGELAAAREELERLIGRDPGFSEPYPLLGKVLTLQGDRAAAIEAYRGALARGVVDRQVFLSLGELLLGSGAPGEAREVLTTARGVFPGECEVDALFGRSLEETGQGAQAVQVLREVVARDPGCHVARENLGLLFMNSGEWSAAEQVFLASLDAFGAAYPVDHLNLGLVYAIGLRQPDAAREAFGAYARLDPAGAGRIPREYREGAVRHRGTPAGGP